MYVSLSICLIPDISELGSTECRSIVLVFVHFSAADGWALTVLASAGVTSVYLLAVLLLDNL